MLFSWRPPRYIRDRTELEHQRLRDKYHILADGEDIPSPIEHFEVCIYQHLSLLLPTHRIGYENTRAYIGASEVKTHYHSYSDSTSGNTGCVRAHAFKFHYILTTI